MSPDIEIWGPSINPPLENLPARRVSFSVFLKSLTNKNRIKSGSMHSSHQTQEIFRQFRMQLATTQL